MLRKIQDIELEIDPVGRVVADKVHALVMNYTRGRISVRPKLIEVQDTNYKYIFYIDASNPYMKKKPNKQEVQNITNYILGIIDCMRSY